MDGTKHAARPARGDPRRSRRLASDTGVDGAAAAAVTAGANLGLDLHGELLWVGWIGRSTQRDRREATLDGHGAWLQIKMSPPPQSRPARTLVLIFMVSSFGLDGWDESTQRDRREVTLDGHDAWLQIKMSPPQSRPARTLVLIFMVSSFGLGGWDEARSATGARQASAVTDMSLQISGTTPPQSRPARTLVLIFMVSSFGLGGWDEARSATGARRPSTVTTHWLQIPMSMPVVPPPPQSRPARTLVLIFMVGS